MEIKMMYIRYVPNSTVATHRQNFMSRTFRLEEEYPEETEILEIEIDISEGSKTEQEIADLKQKRDLVLDKWINRIQEDKRNTRNPEKKRSLDRELDRAISYKHSYS
jgi:hypothetical protein